MRLVGMVVWLSAGCSGDDDSGGMDTGTELTVDQLCAGEGPSEVLLGTGAGGAFAELTDGASVGLDIAPQGGFGVTVQLQTWGLLTEDAAIVQLDTEVGGVLSGTFTNEELFLYCKDDGSGTVGSGVAVGFDPAVYTEDNLDILDGETVDLVVTVTDADGDSTTGRKTVTIDLGL